MQMFPFGNSHWLNTPQHVNQCEKPSFAKDNSGFISFVSGLQMSRLLAVAEKGGSPPKRGPLPSQLQQRSLLRVRLVLSKNGGILYTSKLQFLIGKTDDNPSN
jgi:hypothetical protein